MTDEQEKWLAGVREGMDGLPDESTGSIQASGVRCLIAEIDRLRAKPKLAGEDELAVARLLYETTPDDFDIIPLDAKLLGKLLAHIDATDGVLHDMQTDAGAMLAYEQGAAEERAGIATFIDGQATHYRAKANGPEGGRYLDDMASRAFACEEMARGVRSFRQDDLMPPAAARVALDAERRKVGVLRAAMGRIVGTSGTMTDRLAKESLEATK